jgi:hypothetical protein
MTKSNEELIEEFLANGGEIEQLPPVEENVETNQVGSVTKKIPQIKTLAEGQLLYAKKQKSRKKKKPNYDDIDLKHIPEHILNKLNIDIPVDQQSTKEEEIETNQNFGRSKASDES